MTDTTIHFIRFHYDPEKISTVVKQCAMFLLLALMLLLLNTIEVSEKCECGLEKGHLGKHQTIQRGSVQQLVEWYRLKQQRSND